MPLQDLIQQLAGNMGGSSGGPPGMGGPESMPPQPPSQPGGMGLPEIPTGDSASMGSQVQSLSTQLTHIGAQLMSRGMHDAAISCAKAVKELSKVPQLISEHAQNSNPPPNMNIPGMEQGVPQMPPMGPPPLPGMA